ncbi:hypothetical protein GCM10010112_42550 [Actinoplanes lobatus]|uniref:Uncharacterized protein n=1 Tax=Actinoplanes lobatus TaxID=113568 RepID=A0ABQ4AGY5_9ACTN|nr:hypothetical protein GCM10010112_42550 [Actinoplanes lobatus]GIE39734.1 hypothetical protein Alo02nite_26320 [Actinoplanes lobatus]
MCGQAGDTGQAGELLQDGAFVLDPVGRPCTGGVFVDHAGPVGWNTAGDLRPVTQVEQFLTLVTDNHTVNVIFFRFHSQPISWTPVFRW